MKQATSNSLIQSHKRCVLQFLINKVMENASMTRELYN